MPPMPQLTVADLAPVALPAVVPQAPVLPALPEPPRTPLIVKLDDFQRPFMRLGPLVFVVTTAIPVAVCLAGAAAAGVTGGNPAAWTSAISFAAPLGTVGLPWLMIAVNVAATVKRARMRPTLAAYERQFQRVLAERAALDRAATAALPATEPKPTRD